LQAGLEVAVMLRKVRRSLVDDHRVKGENER
jgi:hypothetical protein